MTAARSRQTLFVPTPPSPDRQPTRAGLRPRTVERILYGALIALAVVGVLSPGRYSLLPAETILEGVFILIAVVSMSRIDVAARSILVLALAYVALKVGLMAFGHSSAWLDFIQANKAYFYLLGLAFFVRRGMFDQVRLAKFMKVLLIFFSIKYSYSQVLGLDSRPGLYLENNFELIMLIGLFYLAYPSLGRRRNIWFGVLAADVLLSGSRSAALALVLLYVVLYLRMRNRFWPLHLLGVSVVGYAVFVVFAGRDPRGLNSIDRYHFLQVFLGEVKAWPLWEFLTGSYPITPLSPAACGDLSFYERSFSLSQPGVCYSVILHSYLLRAIFDEGLLGLVLLYVLLGMALARSGASRRDIVLLLGIMTLSGLSVSAFNNVFATFTFAVALGLDRRRRTAELPRSVRAGPPVPHVSANGPGADGSPAFP